MDCNFLKYYCWCECGLMEKSKVTIDDIIGIVKTDEPTDSVELKKELYNNTWGKLDKKHKVIIMKENLLEEIRHELVSINGLSAYDSGSLGVHEGADYIQIDKEDIVRLNYDKLIEKIDKVL